MENKTKAAPTCFYSQATARRILKGTYAEGWDPEVQAGTIDYAGWFDADPPPGQHEHVRAGICVLCFWLSLSSERCYFPFRALYRASFSIMTVH